MQECMFGRDCLTTCIHHSWFISFFSRSRLKKWYLHIARFVNPGLNLFQIRHLLAIPRYWTLRSHFIIIIRLKLAYKWTSGSLGTTFASLGGFSFKHVATALKYLDKLFGIQFENIWPKPLFVLNSLGTQNPLFTNDQKRVLHQRSTETCVESPRIGVPAECWSSAQAQSVPYSIIIR